MARSVSSSAVLPVRAVLLGRRVRVLVAVTLTHAVVLGALTWAVGGGLSGPGVAGLAVHVAVSVAAALPVWWQFSGDPVARERRAVRAMALSFAGLAAYSAADAVRDATGDPLPGESVVGAVLAVVVAGALVALAAHERRERRAEGPDGAGVPAAFGPAVVASTVALLAAAAADLLAATTVGGPAVSAVVAVLAVREAVRARTAGAPGAAVAAPVTRTNGTVVR